VSDGKNIFVVMGTGIVASYDLDGNRNWITYLNVEPTSPYGRSAPPRLVGDLLIAPVDVLHALDTKTGKLAWKSPDADSGYGASAVVELPGGGGAAATKLLVTPKGLVVRVKDGKVLAKEVGVVEYASPVAQGDTVYFVAAQCSAVKLSAKGPVGPNGPDAVETKELWNTDLDGEFFASPVLYDGFLYTVNKDAVYDVIDAKTGKVALTGPLQLPPKGEPGEPTGTFAYPSVSLAAGRLFVGNTKGDWEVLDPAARADLKAAQVRLNTLPDGSPASAAFADEQVFIRAGAQLYCIAAPLADKH
jgi:outer membrane protein assembly factor BamB